MFKTQKQSPKCSMQKGVLRNFTKFTGKHLCQSLFFNKVACLTPATLLKRRLWHRCFPLSFVKRSENAFFTEHLWWLLLKTNNKLKVHYNSANIYLFKVTNRNNRKRLEIYSKLIIKAP